MSEQEDSRSMAVAARALVEFRRRRESGDPVDFDAFCAEHPDIAESLRFLDSVYSVGGTSDATISFRDLIAQKLGEGALEGFFGAEGKAGDADAPAMDTPLDPAGRYLSRDEVGRGGMSRILRVWDRNLGRLVAMKMALDSLGSKRPAGGMTPRRDAFERFLGEAYITARLESNRQVSGGRMSDDP